MSQHMKFENEKGAGRAKWVAGALILGIVGWMGSGYVIPHEDEAEAEAPVTAAQSVKLVTVEAERSEARAVIDVFLAEGQAKAEKDVAIRPETGGSVLEVLVARGATLAEGQVIARIDPAQRRADLQRTRAEQVRAQREFDNAEALLARGVATNDRVEQARAALAAARAGVANAEASMSDLDIIAPIAGHLERLSLEAGEFISPGTELGRIVVTDPLTVSVRVPQQRIGALREGLPAQVDFITGVQARGELTFLGTVADAATRTFEAEITVANPDGAIPAGLSAQVYIPTGESRGHFISPAILSLSTEGLLGVKAVSEDNIVIFYPVDIIRAETDGVWIDGLPETLDIIKVGQGFVTAGEQVEPVFASDAPPEADTVAEQNQ